MCSREVYKAVDEERRDFLDTQEMSIPTKDPPAPSKFLHLP